MKPFSEASLSVTKSYNYVQKKKTKKRSRQIYESLIMLNSFPTDVGRENWRKI